MNKKLVNQIPAYRVSHTAGNITVIATADTYGNITAAVEQSIYEPITGEKGINVLAPVRVADIDTAIDALTKVMNDGNKENQQDMGLNALDENIASYKKAIEGLEQRRAERVKGFSDGLEDLKLLREHIAAAIAAKETEMLAPEKATAKTAAKTV